MSDPVTIVTVAPRPTAVVAASTTWAEFPGLWKGLLDQVWAFLGEHPGLRTDGHNVMLYLDSVPNVEVGVIVTGPFTGAGNVVPSTLPVGRAAMTVHRGAYGGLGQAHTAVRNWCESEGKELAGPSWEIYGDHDDDESKLETEVYWLLARAGESRMNRMT